jgi:hypothetical protein
MTAPLVSTWIILAVGKEVVGIVSGGVIDTIKQMGQQV